MKYRALLGIVSGLSLSLFAFSSLAWDQARPVPAFEENTLVKSREMPSQAKQDSVLEGRLSPSFFEAKALLFQLGDRELILYKTVPAMTDNWSGRSSDGRSDGTFTRYKGVVVGTIRSDSDIWELRPAYLPGNTLIYQLDSSILPDEGPLRRPPGG
jgi:hypothetical protein